MPLTLTLLMKPPHLLTVSLNSQSLVLMSVFLGPFGCPDPLVSDLVSSFTQDKKWMVSTDAIWALATLATPVVAVQYIVIDVVCTQIWLLRR